MYLRKIEISGFKSFARKTSLEFLAPCDSKKSKKFCGITAIVGPNGTGKSNIADAIRWTMGEQSMKNLRGRKSEDVIFSGSGQKARLGSAQVTLFLDNNDKKIPVDFSEVSVSRKLFRSGESEYFINESRVRLIDVVDLLAKAGMGKESYCVINQGMSDAILSSSPADRMTVVEDAAGVKPFQIKKERAIRKLESTQVNLQRVNDLINEITPHLRLLKRQADKAARAKDLGCELEKKQAKLYSFLWYNFQKERENFLAEKNYLGSRMMNAQRAADKISDELSSEAKYTEQSNKIRKLEKEREELRRFINNLERELIISEGRLEIEKERKIEKEIIEKIPVDVEFVRKKLARIRVDQEKLIARLEKVEDLSEIQELKELARAIQQELFDLYEKSKKGSIEVKRELSAEFRVQQEKIDALSRKCAELREEIKKKEKEEDKLNQLFEEEKTSEQRARQKIFDLERTLRAKQDELNKIKDAFNEAKINLAKIEVREEDLIHEIKNELKKKPEELKYEGGEIDREHLEKEIIKLKIRLEQAGGIDPLVTEEYEETRKRHEFLTQESEDLKKAIKSCHEVIKEMNGKIKKAFDEAFEQINKEFTKYFRIIFGGGNAHLIKIRNQKPKIKIGKETEVDAKNVNALANEDETLEEIEEVKEEAGIDIFACPPGKKISNLNMLSGGERSLTSIALLFAIISYNPPPFAVMDEVEAALDEANSRRFGRILQELSTNTQFIIITHNRETMRQASLLYGVTMGEDGISKLLSVNLDDKNTENRSL